MYTLTLLNAGCEQGAMTLNAAEELKKDVRRVLHTGRCPLGEWLTENGLAFETLDSLYDEAEDFDGHIGLCMSAVKAMLETGDVLYCVMSFEDETAKRLARETKNVRVIGAGSPEDALRLYADGRTMILSATEAVSGGLSSHENVILTEMDNRALACEVKLKLMEAFPDEWTVLVKKPDGGIARIALEKLDRMRAYDHRVCVLVPAITDIRQAERYDARHLLEIVAKLRDPENGCPWDKEQTHESLRSSMLEETYEAADAIDRGDTDSLYDELGDVMLHIALHAQIASEYGEFDASDITTAICRKMIRRHPHIFAGAEFSSVEEINAAWEKIKREEKKDLNTRETLRSAARAMPAMMRAEKVIWRAEKAGFRTPETEKTDAETLGKQLFDAAVRAHQSRISAEDALNAAIDVFIDSIEG